MAQSRIDSAARAHALDDYAAGEVVTPRRPEPTPEQARFGIIPAATANGTAPDVTEWLKSAPHFDGTHDEFEAFERAIADNRAMRRLSGR